MLLQHQPNGHCYPCGFLHIITYSWGCRLKTAYPLSFCACDAFAGGQYRRPRLWDSYISCVFRWSFPGWSQYGPRPPNICQPLQSTKTHIFHTSLTIHRTCTYDKLFPTLSNHLPQKDQDKAASWTLVISSNIQNAFTSILLGNLE